MTHHDAHNTQYLYDRILNINNVRVTHNNLLRIKFNYIEGNNNVCAGEPGWAEFDSEKYTSHILKTLKYLLSL